MAEFLDKARDQNVQGVLLLAEQEATAVERRLCRKDRATPRDARLRDYAATLKEFIGFLRYGVKTRKVRRLDLEAFSHLGQGR